MAELVSDTTVDDGVLDVETARVTLKEGKALIDTNPEKAVELLCAAVRAYEKHYGGDAIDCAPVYMYYGIALYEFARSSIEALGTAKTTVECKSGQEEDQAAPEPAAASSDGGKGSSGAGAPGSTEEGTTANITELTTEPMAEDDPKTGDAEAGAEMETGSGDPDDTGAADKDDGDEDEEDEDEGRPDEDNGAEDMRLAWDMLELARVVYSKNNPEEHVERLAEVHKGLGDIKSEQERFEEAVDCYKQSLQYLESMQPRDNRRLAEVQYKISVVLTFLEQPEEALQVTQAALASLEAAVAETEEKLAALPTDGSGGDAAEEEGRRLQSTSDDLRGVIAELHWNIKGLKETIASNNSLKELLRRAMLKAHGGSEAVGVNASELAAPLGGATATSTSKPFAAPSNPAAASQAVSLGTVGRGSKRITLQPTGGGAVLTSTAAATAKLEKAGAPPAPAPLFSGAPVAKRTLEDLMAGAPSAGCVVSTSSDAVAGLKADGDEAQQLQQQAKKVRTEEPGDEEAE